VESSNRPREYLRQELARGVHGFAIFQRVESNVLLPRESVEMIGAALVLSTLFAVADHSAANPLFQELRTRGISLGESSIPLPPPAMADGLGAAAQTAVLTRVVDERYPLDEFTRDAVVAPFVLKFPELPSGKVMPRGIDVWFIVRGDLNELAKVDVLKEFTSARGKDTTLHVLTADELKARGLPLTSADSPKHVAAVGATEERFVHTVANVLDHVVLHQTMRCALSRTNESVVIASQVDRRFDKDREFPNLYHRLIRNDDGEITKGPAQPYSGSAGGYMKATQLADPMGAILVEYHTIYSEPHDWFNGANLLQSKLPILLQSRVRELRREVREAQK
jgi:hypothetical protein